jgi:hypothetical protein
VLAAVRVVTAPDGQPMALARAEDRTGSLPLVLFPPVYGRAAPLCVPGTAVIVTARVQQAEVWEGGGSPVVLIAERVLPYKVEAQGPQLDVTPVQQPRAPRAERAPRPAKDPTEFSKTGVRYYRAPRNGDLAPPDDLPEPPPDLLEPPIEAYDEPPPIAEYGLRIAESAPPATGFRPPPPSVPPARQETAPPAANSTARNPLSASDGNSAIRGAPGAPQSAIVITLPPPADEAADEARMRALRAILRRFPGATPVMLAFPDDLPGGAPTLLPLRHGVDASPDLREAITALLGAECLTLE